MIGIDHAMREFHETHVLLVKKAPSLKDILDAQTHAAKGLRVLKHVYALIAMGIYECAPPPPPDGNPLFEPSGEPTAQAALNVPGSEDPYISKQRMDCAREIMSLFDEMDEIMAPEMMELLSKTWDRDKIVRPVLKRFTEAGVLVCDGNTRGAVYSKASVSSVI